jgi:hypothetical protein
VSGLVAQAMAAAPREQARLVPGDREAEEPVGDRAPAAPEGAEVVGAAAPASAVPRQ